MNYYEFTANVQRIQDDGTEKAVSEKLLIRDEALLAAVQKAEAMYVGQGEAETIACAQTKIIETLGEPSEHIFEAKVAMITIDEKTQKEKQTVYVYAVWADSFIKAEATVNEFMHDALGDFRIKGIKETKYIDIIS